MHRLGRGVGEGYLRDDEGEEVFLAEEGVDFGEEVVMSGEDED